MSKVPDFPAAHMYCHCSAGLPCCWGHKAVALPDSTEYQLNQLSKILAHNSTFARSPPSASLHAVQRLCETHGEAHQLPLQVTHITKAEGSRGMRQTWASICPGISSLSWKVLFLVFSNPLSIFLPFSLFILPT